MKKIIIISILVILILVGVGVTYSMYTSASSTTTDISLAAFIVNAEKKEQNRKKIWPERENRAVSRVYAFRSSRISRP